MAARHTATGNKGFTYVFVLIVMIFTGIGLAASGKVWSTIMNREREEELLFRGNQIKMGIESYYKSGHGGVNFYPRSLDDLLKDNRFLTVKRHLRKIYKDPMTKDGEWDIIRNELGRITGVRTKARKEPIKIKGFPKEYVHFENKKSISEWEFVFQPKKEKQEK